MRIIFFLRTFESTRFDFHEHEGHWFAGLGQEVLQKPSAKPSGAADSCRSPRMTLTMDSEVRNLVKHGEAFFWETGDLIENSGAPGGPRKWVWDLSDWGFSHP